MAARSRAATHGQASQHRRPRPVRRRSASNQHAEPSTVIGLVMNAAVLIEETVVNFAARLTLGVIGSFEAVLRRVLRFEERAAETMAEAVEAVPREASQVIDKVGAVAEQLAAA